MALERNTSTLNVGVNTAGYQAVGGPAVPQAQQARVDLSQANLFAGLGNLAVAWDRRAEAEAKLQGVADEFAGVDKAAEHSNIFTQDAYNAGVSQQRTLAALNDFQAKSMDAMQQAAERGMSPGAFVDQQRREMAGILATTGAQMDAEDYNALILQGNQTLRSAGTAYTGYRLKYDTKVQTENVQTQGNLVRRQMLLARAPAPTDANGIPDTSRFLEAYRAGIKSIVDSGTPLTPDAVSKELETTTEFAATSMVTDGPGGIANVNGLYNAVLQDPNFGGMKPEQSEKVLKSLEALRTRAGKEYLSDIKQAAETGRSNAEMGIPLDKDALKSNLSKVQQLRNMNFITPTEYNQIVSASNAALVADYQREHKPAQPGSPAAVISAEQATKAFRAAMGTVSNQGKMENDVNVQELVVLDDFGTQAINTGNPYLTDLVATHWKDRVHGWTTMALPKSGEPLAADVGFMNLLKNAYTQRGQKDADDRWTLYTANMEPEDRQRLVQVLQTGKGQSDELLLKRFADSAKVQINLQSQGLTTAQIQEASRVPVGLFSATDRFTDSVANGFARAWGMLPFTDKPGVTDVEARQARVEQFFGPAYTPVVQRMLETNPGKYAGLNDPAKYIQQDALTLARKLRFDAPLTEYGVMVHPGVGDLPIARELVDEATGEPSKAFQLYVANLMAGYHQQHPNSQGFEGIRIYPAGNEAVVEGLPTDAAKQGTVTRLAVLNQHNLGQFLDKHYQAMSEMAASAAQSKSVVIGKQMVMLNGANPYNLPGKTFINAQELSARMAPPTTTLQPMQIAGPVNGAVGAADKAMATLGVSRQAVGAGRVLSPDLESNYMSLFLGAEAARRGNAVQLARDILKIRREKGTIPEAQIESDLRARYGSRMSTQDWQQVFLPQFRAVLNEVPTATP